MEQGDVVLINGTSSAGKTSVARALQEIMETPYVHTGVDHFLGAVPERCFALADRQNAPPAQYFLLLYEGLAERATAEVEGGVAVFGLGRFAGLRIGPGGVKLLAGMYRGVAALAAAGVNVVVDDVIHDPRVLAAAAEALRDAPTLFVGLRLPREVAERRERERGDRGPGGALAFYDLVHAHASYDLELDTAALSPMECALRIKQALENGHPRRAI
ncbi:MAG: hypothetical protein JOZ41_18345, partial [Chloroflexi bacterium]|nr:hypothetical protein [Chloroflexota bacterium]